MRKRYLFLLIIFLLGFTGSYLFFGHDKQQMKIPEVITEQLPAVFQSASPSPLPQLVLPPIPSTKVLPGGTHVFQTFNNCGPASLSMALSYYDIRVTQQVLGQALRPHQHPTGDNDDKSVTLLELAKKAEEYDMLVYHRPAGDVELLEQFIAQDIPVVTRTWLKVGEDIGHYRVVKGYDQTTRQLIQDDSLQGKDLRYTYENFLELWQSFNYEFLVLVPKEKQAVAEAILGERTQESHAWERALILANDQLKDVPNDLYAQFNRSVALYHLGRYQESVQAFEMVEQRLPSRMLWYQIEPILSYFKLGRDERVLSITDKILSNHNRAFSELYYLRGLVYQKQGNTALADDTFRKADQYNSSPYWKHNLYLE